MSVTASSRKIFDSDQSIITRDAFPNSRKIYVEGSDPSIQVPMREIAQAPTTVGGQNVDNPPITVYDPSGPYTDPKVDIDVRKGLNPLPTVAVARRTRVWRTFALSACERPCGLPVVLPPAQIDYHQNLLRYR